MADRTVVSSPPSAVLAGVPGTGGHSANLLPAGLRSPLALTKGAVRPAPSTAALNSASSIVSPIISPVSPATAATSSSSSSPPRRTSRTAVRRLAK